MDYNVSIQILKYMACIWAEYEKHFGTNYKEKVNNRDYSNKELLEHRDEMSLIMLLNKIQTVADLSG